MRGSPKSMAAAVGMFGLIAGVVLGGMTWATVTQLRLAEVEAIRRHQSKLRQALWRMEGPIAGILGSEFARPYTHYLAFHSEKPAAAWTEDGRRVEVDTVAMPSPLALSGPSHDWIDLYFHVDEDGRWSSPQLWDESIYSYRISNMLDWLKGVLPVAEIPERVAGARQRDRPGYRPTGEPRKRTVQVVHHRGGAAPSARPDAWDEYLRRAESKNAAQMSALPSSQCVAQDHIHVREALVADGGLYACSQPTFVGISHDPIAAFWLEPKPGEGLKLAFIRTGHDDDKMVYQGFVADWGRLKPELLKQIQDLFPDADLEPAADDRPPDLAASETQLSAIPVRLTGPDVLNTGVAEARRSILSVLITTWVLALAILALAGLGVRNLIALTNRRLQFAYAVTHELRTPLTTFRLYSDMLAAGLVPDDAKQAYFETLDRESLRLSNLVQGVLEYARLENQQVQLNPVDTDAQSLLCSVTRTLEERCKENGVRAEAKNDIPPDSKIRADVDLVNQIAGVLVENAVRHARGSSDPAVMVHLGRENGKLHLDVIDTGAGVDRADARTIFKPFRRGRGAAAAAQRGIGLGLALARNWATLLGGRLDLIARHDPTYGGAHFRLTIPAHLDG